MISGMVLTNTKKPQTIHLYPHLHQNYTSDTKPLVSAQNKTIKSTLSTEKPVTDSMYGILNLLISVGSKEDYKVSLSSRKKSMN